MKKRLLSMLLAISVLISLIPAFAVSAAEEVFPETLTLMPNNGNRLPSWIDLTPDPSGEADQYHLYLPGNANLINCFLSWNGGMLAEYNGNEYDSGQLPVAAPGESATYTFRKGSQTKTFTVRVFQGSPQLKTIFIEIDESQGTIYDMNHDRNHQTTCTGQIIIDGKRMNLPQIKGRGNYSWQQAKEKRPYNFKLDSKVNLLGIDSEKTKKWSLLANTNDHTLLRNKVAYDLAHAMGIGLDSTSVDMWMNGQYQGVYLLTPKTDSFVTDEGFLVENNNYAETIPISEGGDPTFYVGSSNESVSAGGGGGGGFPGGGWGMGSNGGLLTNIKGIGDKWLEGGEETTETITAAAKAIRAYLEDAWAALKTNDGYNSKQQYYTEFFDMPTTAAMYLLHEYVKNLEVTGGSIFFHRDGMTEADKLKGGPAWDYDNALAFNGTSFGGWGGGGGSQQNSYQRLDGWYITGQNRSGLLGSLGKHQDLLDETYRIYNIYYRAFDDVCQNLLREADKIEQSAEMNFARFTKETMNAFDVSSDKTIGAGTEWEITYKKTDTWRDYIENLYRYTEGRARYFKYAMYDEDAEHGYGAIFEQGAYSDVTVYDTQDLSGEGALNPDVAYARDAATGELDTSGEGSIYFKVDTAEGYELDRIIVEPAANYTALQTVPGKAGVYCLSGVKGSVIITVRAAAISQTTFVCDEGVTIDVLKTQNANGVIFENVTSAFPRNGDTGEIDVSGDGQVNFIVKVADGYSLDSVTAEPAGYYKNLKGPSETGTPNCYRMTKIIGDVTVTVKATKVSSGGCEHEYQAEVTAPTCTAQGFTTHTCSKCGDSYVDSYTAKIKHNYQNGVCTVCGEKLINVAIDCDAGATVTVLETQSAEGPKAENAKTTNPRDGDTGFIDCSGEGQVNFVVNLAEGYALEGITAGPAGTYKNLKGPEDTGIENGYRITKITGDLTINITTRKTGEEPTPPYATFVLDEGASVSVYEKQDLSGEPLVNPEMAFARDSATGEISMGGQVNFVVNVENGYKLESVTAEPAANYNNLKGPDETMVNNCYRVTKMTGPVTVTVKVTEAGPCEHDYEAVVTPATCTAQGFTTYTCSKCGDSYVGDYTAKIPHSYENGACTVCGEKLLNVRIDCGEGASVTVLETQKADGPKTENAAQANPRDGDTGLIDCSGEGQVNFVVNLEEGYELESVTAEPAGSYKNLKGSADTGIENGYRITKVKGDFTITVTAKKTGEPVCEHNYTAVVTPPTCTEKGYTTYTCTKCGDSYTGDEVDALEHDFVDGVCTRCGAADPDYIPPADKTELDKAVKAAGMYDENDYTPESYAPLAEALEAAKAVQAKEDAAQGEVDAAAKAVNDAIAGLEKKPDALDKDALISAIAAAEALDPAEYTEESAKALADGIASAKDALASAADQAAVDAAVAALDEVVKGLEKKPDEPPFLFEDVKDEGKFYFTPVYWAYNAEPQITNGKTATLFGPDDSCTRGQVVTFLWRAAGCPEPKSAETPFTDLKEGGFYVKAVAWAVENEITNGLSATTFGPDATCTRGQIVTFLWRFAGQEEPKNAKTDFTDVSESAFYAKAVAWAVENEVTNGMTPTTFAPGNTCTRGQVVTFLYRATAE